MLYFRFLGIFDIQLNAVIIFSLIVLSEAPIVGLVAAQPWVDGSIPFKVGS